MKWHRARLLPALCAMCLFPSFTTPVLASFPVLEWTEVDIPGDNDLTIVAPSEVTDIAAGDNGVLYAVDGENGRMYRSSNYGVDWADITEHLKRSDVPLPAAMVAVAPDDEGVVAVLADGGTSLYVSLDGGCEWEDTRLPGMGPGEEVTTIAVSGVYEASGRQREYREIAVGTARWGDDESNGQVYILQGACAWCSWEEQQLTVDSGDPLHIGADVSALEYSKSYSYDDTLLVVCSTASDLTDTNRWNKTFLALGLRDKQDGGTDWGFFSDYPVEIDGVAGDAAGVSHIRSMLALPADYTSNDEDRRNVFLGIEREPDSNDNVYRVVDDEVDLLDNDRMDVDGESTIDIWSIAYRGDMRQGTLLAGETDPVNPGALNVQVHRCLDPFAPSPDWEESAVPPTGPGLAVLAWAPDVSLAYCGTSSQPGEQHDESAFSASMYGDLWRQMALIDTELTLTHLVVTPDGEDLFLATSNEWGPESVWHSYTDPLGERWERVLTIDSDSDAVMIELSQEYEEDDTIYVAEHNGYRLALTYDGGDSWRWQHDSPEPVLDLVVPDRDTLYAAIPGGRVMKSTRHGWTWHDPVDTGLDAVNMLHLAADGALFVGGTNGYVSWSRDDESFMLLSEEDTPETGNVQVITDIGFETNGWIYAATGAPDAGLWRWKLGTSDHWQQMDVDVTSLAAGQEIGGLIQGPEGTLYPLRSEPSSENTGGMTRWLCPTCRPCADLQYDHVVEGLPDDVSFAPADEFTTSYPVGTLWSNAVETDVFAIDSAGQRIFMYRDTLCKRGPDQECPADESELDPNPCACNRDAVVAFDWEELDEVDEYEWCVYLEASLSEPLWSGWTDYDGIVISPHGDTTDFHSGMRYGWRVRTTEPVLSPWSALWTFTPVLCPVTGLVPGVGASSIALAPVFTWDSQCTADGFDFVLANDPSYTDAVVELSGADALTVTSWACSQTLEPSTHYFWRVRPVRGDARGEWMEGHFTTRPEPEASASPAGQVIEMPAQQSAGAPETAVWLLFGLVVILLLLILVLVMRTAARH